MYNFDTKIIGNSSWKQLEILSQENIGPHLKGMSILSSTFMSKSDSIIIDPKNLSHFQSGFNASRLLTNIKLSEISRTELSKSLNNVIFNGAGYSYFPSKDNKNINSAFQLIGFNGADFVKEGVISIDSLSIHNTVNP